MLTLVQLLYIVTQKMLPMENAHHAYRRKHFAQIHLDRKNAEKIISKIYMLNYYVS
jgi:hypothetical protein